MSIFSERGIRIVTNGRKGTRIKDAEAIEERDRAVWTKRCEGLDRPTVAKMFRITERYVRIIEKRLPWEVKQEIAIDVREHMQARRENLYEASRLG